MNPIMFCPNCGSPLDSEAAFCSGCGMRVGDEVAHSAPALGAKKDPASIGLAFLRRVTEVRCAAIVAAILAIVASCQPWLKMASWASSPSPSGIFANFMFAPDYHIWDFGSLSAKISDVIENIDTLLNKISFLIDLKQYITFPTGLDTVFDALQMAWQASLIVILVGMITVLVKPRFGYVFAFGVALLGADTLFFALAVAPKLSLISSGAPLYPIVCAMLCTLSLALSLVPLSRVRAVHSEIDS